MASGANASVIRVVDGDTIVVSLGGTEEKVRLIGIDTPETKKPGAGVECFGEEASNYLHELLPDATFIRLERDKEERDRYGRLLAYAYRWPDGLFVNAAMAVDGYAAELTIPPNVAHASELGTLVRQARVEQKGRWSACPGSHDSARGPPG